MSEQVGEKTELPTQRKLEESLKRGQIPRSAEVQTVFVLLGGLGALTFAGPEIWHQFTAGFWRFRRFCSTEVRRANRVVLCPRRTSRGCDPKPFQHCV
jgi:flagellar biosynthesis protein FlhB